MRNRLSVCSSYLLEVEEKLLELQSSIDDAQETAKISKALSFVHEARKAISAARTTVESLNGMQLQVK
jgi:hypothetical protein